MCDGRKDIACGMHRHSSSSVSVLCAPPSPLLFSVSPTVVTVRAGLHYVSWGKILGSIPGGIRSISYVSTTEDLQTIHRLLISNLLVVSDHDDTLESKKKDVIRCNLISW
jgi:hypothetical protein